MALIEVKNLTTRFVVNRQLFTAVDNANLRLNAGEVLGLVGESGCGKSVLVGSMLRLLRSNLVEVTGQVFYNGEEILGLPYESFRSYYGKQVSLIFQEAQSSLSPVFTIGFQLAETVRLHHPELSTNEVHNKTLDLLSRVGLPDPESLIKAYSHQLSGGMKQRVMIALAISAQPQVLIADEATSSLDVIIQDQILDLLKSLVKEMNMSLLLISHDFGVVSEMCDSVAVMNAGKIIEHGPRDQILNDPKEAYTRKLISSARFLPQNM